MTENELKEAADLLTAAGTTMALTGAGISVDSGIPAFRGAQGLWARYDMMEYAHIDSFKRNPEKVWQMLLELDGVIAQARPNAAHVALAELEGMGLLQMVVTQNVDNLHQEAGSREVVEFHGNAGRLVCLNCRQAYTREEVDLSVLPPRCACQGLIKPDVIFFGEAIPWAASAKAFQMAEACDLILVVATSAVVAPASEIPILAKRSGARVIELNTEETILTRTVTDLLLQGSATEILPAVVQILKDRRH